MIRERRWRVLGLTFVVFFVLMEVMHGKNYYVFPIYPVAFAAGATVIERWLANRLPWTRVAVVIVIVLGTAPFLPMSIWLLPPERMLAYQNRIGFKPDKAEVHMQSLLIQPIADQFGWPDMVREIASVYNSLPPEERPALAQALDGLAEALQGLAEELAHRQEAAGQNRGSDAHRGRGGE